MEFFIYLFRVSWWDIELLEDHGILYGATNTSSQLVISYDPENVITLVKIVLVTFMDALS